MIKSKLGEEKEENFILEFAGHHGEKPRQELKAGA